MKVNGISKNNFKTQKNDFKTAHDVSEQSKSAKNDSAQQVSIKTVNKADTENANTTNNSTDDNSIKNIDESQAREFKHVAEGEHKESFSKIREEGQKNIRVSSLLEKLSSGSKLTGGELDYLNSNAEAVYGLALDASEVRQAFLSQLKQCTSKEEVEQLARKMEMEYDSRVKHLSKNPANESETIRQKTFKNTSINELNTFLKTFK